MKLQQNAFTRKTEKTYQKNIFIFLKSINETYLLGKKFWQEEILAGRKFGRFGRI